MPFQPYQGLLLRVSIYLDSIQGHRETGGAAGTRVQRDPLLQIDHRSVCT
jgi:hypothetical protein